MTSIDRARPKLDLGRVFGDTFGVIRRQAVLLIGITLVLYVLPSALGGLMSRSAISAARASRTPFAIFTSPLYWTTLAIGVLLGVFVLACQLTIALGDLEGRRLSFSQVFSLAARKSLPLLAGTVLLVLGLWIGMIFLFVPGIILGVTWAVTLPAVVGETSNIFRAFGRSRALTHGNRWRILGLALIVGVMMLIGDGLLLFLTRGMTAATVGGLAIGSMFVGALLSLVYSLAASVGSAALYVQLRELKGAGGDAVAQVFA